MAEAKTFDDVNKFFRVSDDDARYRNKFRDGPNDKPKKKKKKATRTNHPTWGDILKSGAPKSLKNRKHNIDKKVKEGS